MSTTPITFKESLIPYTMVSGGKQEKLQDREYSLSILLLNRGGRFYREDLFREIGGLEHVDILYIEGPELSYDVEPLSRQYPLVRFMLLKDNISIGEKINLGFAEARASLVLVMWSDMKSLQTQFSTRFMEKVRESGILCTLPVIKSHKREVIPSIQVPGFIKKRLKIMPWKSIKEGVPSAFPFDFCGLYNKERYLILGGYDGSLRHPYWQKMDFGFRAWLWGEEIRLNPSFALAYTLAVATEDNTPDESYLRFYLKNLAVYRKGSRCGIKPFTLPSYLANSRYGFFRAFKEFRSIKQWVRENKERFQFDLKGVIDQWEPPE